MVAVPTLLSGLPEATTTEIFKNTGTSLTGTFLIVKVKGLCFGPSRGNWEYLYAKYTLTLQYP